MPLHGPTDHDQTKLHSEVNQIVSQRFILATLAVTAFAAMSAWIVPKDPLPPGGDVGLSRYVASALLLVVLFSLFILTHRLKSMLRIITTYLLVTGASTWEDDWKLYRSSGYASYTKAQTGMFLVLGILAVALPLVLSVGYQLTLAPIGGAIALGVTGTLYAIFLCGMGFGSWWDHEASAEQRWRHIAEA